MSITLTYAVGAQGAGDPVNANTTVTVDGVTRLSVAVPANSTDCVVSVAVDVSQTKLLVLYSAQDVVVKTNSDTAADATVSLTGGVPLVWDSRNGQTHPFASVDVTSLHMDGNTTATTLEVLVGYDATP